MTQFILAFPLMPGGRKPGCAVAAVGHAWLRRFQQCLLRGPTCRNSKFLAASREFEWPGGAEGNRPDRPDPERKSVMHLQFPCFFSCHATAFAIKQNYSSTRISQIQVTVLDALGISVRGSKKTSLPNYRVCDRMIGYAYSN